MAGVSDILGDFSKHIKALEEQAKFSAEAVISGGRRRWFVPPDAGSADVNDPTAINSSFDRTALNNLYEKALLDEGTVGDRIALKQQIDYVAVLERSYRAARASSIRCRAMAAGRSKGHSSPMGVFGGHVMREIQNIVRNSKESRE